MYKYKVGDRVLYGSTVVTESVVGLMIYTNNGFEFVYQNGKWGEIVTPEKTVALTRAQDSLEATRTSIKFFNNLLTEFDAEV